MAMNSGVLFACLAMGCKAEEPVFKTLEEVNKFAGLWYQVMENQQSFPGNNNFPGLGGRCATREYGVLEDFETQRLSNVTLTIKNTVTLDGKRVSTEGLGVEQTDYDRKGGLEGLWNVEVGTPGAPVTQRPTGEVNFYTAFPGTYVDLVDGKYDWFILCLAPDSSSSAYCDNFVILARDIARFEELYEEEAISISTTMRYGSPHRSDYKNCSYADDLSVMV